MGELQRTVGDSDFLVITVLVEGDTDAIKALAEKVDQNSIVLLDQFGDAELSYQASKLPLSMLIHPAGNFWPIRDILSGDLSYRFEGSRDWGDLRFVDQIKGALDQF